MWIAGKLRMPFIVMVFQTFNNHSGGLERVAFVIICVYLYGEQTKIEDWIGKWYRMWFWPIVCRVYKKICIHTSFSLEFCFTYAVWYTMYGYIGTQCRTHNHIRIQRNIITHKRVYRYSFHMIIIIRCIIVLPVLRILDFCTVGIFYFACSAAVFIQFNHNDDDGFPNEIYIYFCVCQVHP